jgi:hypothetical protein
MDAFWMDLQKKLIESVIGAHRRGLYCVEGADFSIWLWFAMCKVAPGGENGRKGTPGSPDA